MAAPAHGSVEPGRLLALAVAGLGLVLAAPSRGVVDDGAADLVRARALEARLAAVVAAVRSTVVTIGIDGVAEGGLPVKSGGSGVHVGRGWVLTNDHVTEGRDAVTVGLVDGRSLEGRVVGRDPVGDVALLSIDAPGLPAATFGDSEGLVPGVPVVALGNPFGLSQQDHEPSVTFGVVSATHRYQGGEKVYGDALQIDAPVNPGNSGGPLFDLEGKLVGITGRIAVRQGLRHNVGVGFAVPAHQVLLVLGRLERGEQIVRGWLGVRFVGLGDGAPGVVVRDVIPGSPAEAAGLLAGDRLVAVDGRPVDQPMRLQNALSVLPAGATVRLRVVRDGAAVELQATLAARRDR